MLKMNRKWISVLFTLSLLIAGAAVCGGAGQRLRCRCLRESWGFHARPATSPPRLNETGYQFRAAGYRMPGDREERRKKPFNFFDYNGVRLQARYDATRARTGRTPHTTIISICSRLSYMPLRALGGSTSRQT